jgi:hypothetical protein
MSPTHSFVSSYAMHTNLLCACWHLEAMKGSSSLTSCRLLILSRLLSSLIWAQLTLFVPALGIWVPLPQNGAPIHRVRAHSLTGIRNSRGDVLVALRSPYFTPEIISLCLHQMVQFFGCFKVLVKQKKCF